MAEFLNALLAFPTIAFTALLGVSLLYWLMVIVGAADLNPFDGADGALDGAVDGALDGAVEGGLHGAEGAVKGAVEGVGHGISHGIGGDAVEASALTEALAWLGLSRVPLTISVSAFSLVGWFLSFTTRHFLDPLLPSALSALVATGISVVGGLFLASFVLRPLGGIFDDKERAGGKAHRGKTVRITTAHVDEKTGQAELEDGGGGLTLNVRSAPGNKLKRGDEAVIMDLDEKEGIYFIEPLRAVLPDTNDAFAAAGIGQQKEAEAPVNAELPNPDPKRNRS